MNQNSGPMGEVVSGKLETRRLSLGSLGSAKRTDKPDNRLAAGACLGLTV
jgi:hypothetical protein